MNQQGVLIALLQATNRNKIIIMSDDLCGLVSSGFHDVPIFEVPGSIRVKEK